MHYNLFDDTVEVIEANQDLLSIFLISNSQNIVVKLEDLTIEPRVICEYIQKDKVIFTCDSDISRVYLFVKENVLYAAKINKETLNDISMHAYDIDIKIFDPKVSIEKTGLFTISISLPYVNEKILIDEFFTDENILLKKRVKTVKYRKRKVLAKLIHQNYCLFVIYDHISRSILIKKSKFEKLIAENDVNIELLSDQKISVQLSKIEKSKMVDLVTLTTKPKRIFSKKDMSFYKDKNLLSLFIVNRTRYYVYLKLGGIYIVKGAPTKVTKFKSNLKVLSFGKNIFIYGRMVHHAYNSFGKYDYLYTINEENKIAKFNRPFKRIKFLKQFGYFKIARESLDLGDRVHYPLFIGTKDKVIHKFPLNRKSEPSKVYAINKKDDKVLVMRTNIYNKAVYSIVPNSKMYNKFNLFKINLAYIISKTLYKNKKYNVNLFFEKQASKADESGIRVYEKVKGKEYPNSKNYFILDRDSKDFYALKGKYGSDVIERFSFRHYLAIFISDYFISSDLSNHVINDRIYINQILNKIKEVPLVFLQHGIMFAKPVENPMGKIFYKDYAAYNVYKNVVSSEMEAREFYKMGYDDQDLLYTGLATFDYAKQNKDSDKIVYMPTYRYWEEGMIYSGDIEGTTYYKSILKVIEAFEKAGLKHRLMIVSHNKFSEYIVDKMPQHRDILGENPSTALKEARIFISDFSSAIYDAIYRGSFPIFYWEDKDYLIKKYQAIPPVNEDNAPGPIAKSLDELVSISKKAIDDEYRLEEKYINKYKEINRFSDNKNTERIVHFLETDGIL
ncbi:CDP-glycerol glycerophosphotransferase family protein [Bacillus spizizenii]|nr:CDP-glycerol glycerophosphotransferase family protein [Bacillus spizizenii]MCY8396239.1 CDP-glycerol glycerophosphotransferase family protein [Bacillus spizizenii]MCY8599705.1 CDP-glycerol glycerophosphotransferase family protein [Bacillus spizizenii]MCY8634156.1 CDP-glycerol glycerophosphotransferase family protein [Bacillus spizizenii]MCY8764433.1 CDP-glycerol glycerophosphotransferase family protein [Bacillus spizizenii]